ncbi:MULTISPECIES: hypothetical protein [unclassified Lysinibacillus]|uniref:hypothetical protein n=1 Tax=unclassified Lysinibacillus TaxID=2636778 RepID=UPI002013B601|nr:MULTISPECIES: hypothetical protein [unclassified Lysinibacillus]MCL1697877.1 hypothetical protein [Lysinibacillus sp. BPa_S21]MCL1702868.1 hypothetical protein [Lysinibacillus sp. Bpr_S20]
MRKRSVSYNVLSVAKAKRQLQCFICAKAKRQRQSAQPERKSTTRYEPGFFTKIAHFYIFVFPQKVLNEDKKFGYSNVRKEVHY